MRLEQALEQIKDKVTSLGEQCQTVLHESLKEAKSDPVLVSSPIFKDKVAKARQELEFIEHLTRQMQDSVASPEDRVMSKKNRARGLAELLSVDGTQRTLQAARQHSYKRVFRLCGQVAGAMRRAPPLAEEMLRQLRRPATQIRHAQSYGRKFSLTRPVRGATRGELAGGKARV